MISAIQPVRPLVIALAFFAWCSTSGPAPAQTAAPTPGAVVAPTPAPASPTPLDVKTLESDAKTLGDEIQALARVQQPNQDRKPANYASTQLQK